MAVLPDWGGLHEAHALEGERYRTQILFGAVLSQQPPIPLRTYLRELRLIAWMLFFAVVVLAMMASGM